VKLPEIAVLIVVSGFRIPETGFVRSVGCLHVSGAVEQTKKKIYFFVLIVLERSGMSEVKTIYLAGAMERAGEYGAVWRSELTPHLISLGYDIWNPYMEEGKTGINVSELAALKKHDFKAYMQFCQKIVDYDIAHLLKCSAVACRIDRPTLQGAGTFGELTFCRINKIPVYAWIDLPGGEYDVPSWAMGCVTSFSTSKEGFYAIIPAAG